MNKLKLVGLGAILCCGLALSQTDAGAATISKNELQGNQMSTKVVNFKNRSLSANILEAIQKNRAGADFTSFHYYGIAGLSPTANYVNKDGYVTTKTTSIHINQTNDTYYELIDVNSGTILSTGRVVGQQIYFDTITLYTNGDYRILGNYNEIAQFDVYEAAENKIPVIKAEDKTIRLGDSFKPLEGVTATDEEDGNLTSSVEVESNNVNTDKAGVYSVTYTVTDSDGGIGTKTIKVTVLSKNTPPTIHAEDRTIYVGDTFDPREGVTIWDAEDGIIPIEKLFISLNEVDTTKIGTYKVIYMVLDSGGTLGMKQISVTVIEREVELPAPELNTVLNTDTTVEGKATKNTTLYLTIAGDKYQETVGDNGTFSLTLDQTYAAGSAIEAYVKDDAGHTSAVYTGTVQKNTFEKPVLDKLTDKDTLFTGSGRANTTLVFKIGNDKYESAINENGLFKATLDQTYPVDTAIEAYILDPATNEKSEISYAKVVAAEEISINRVTSIDKLITGTTFANATIEVKVFGYRDRIYEGASDENGKFNINFTRFYPAGTSMTVKVINPVTGHEFSKTVQVYPRKPSITAILSGDTKVEGLADPLGEIFVTVNNKVTQGIADSAGNYLVRVNEAIPQAASVSVYQVVKGIKSEPTEVIVEQ
ncbi:Ig-like domain-containing protein [Carnobacterium gallinarum]|uniref:Ig-like domain-containing protein n=1 Tax=Carnobacterium gallinarum TaxID=2749 RepID=UPI00068FED50|nr:Ig-like domain-containing protein [Carnobacterium gallinarum]